ncbi:hypothetical protein, partial [Rhizobium anhuiense]|uniref:hypothetical protein n=1 Tax=Rhizobium anhuiense TaxID=1184720 RepID=UPI001AECB930
QQADGRRTGEAERASEEITDRAEPADEHIWPRPRYPGSWRHVWPKANITNITNFSLAGQFAVRCGVLYLHSSTDPASPV